MLEYEAPPIIGIVLNDYFVKHQLPLVAVKHDFLAQGEIGDFKPPSEPFILLLKGDVNLNHSVVVDGYSEYANPSLGRWTTSFTDTNMTAWAAFYMLRLAE